MSKHSLLGDQTGLDPTALSSSEDYGASLATLGQVASSPTPDLVEFLKKAQLLAAAAAEIPPGLSTASLNVPQLAPAHAYAVGSASTPHASTTPAATTQQTTIARSSIALGANVATAPYGKTGAGLKTGIVPDSFNAQAKTRERPKCRDMFV